VPYRGALEPPDELKAYLTESLFMSFNRFENERLAAVVKKAGRAKEE
jgi:hypothetical protein